MFKKSGEEIADAVTAKYLGKNPTRKKPRLDQIEDASISWKALQNKVRREKESEDRLVG